MKENIYQTIARIHGITEAEAKAEMEKAIAAAYENPNEKALQVPRKGEIPTVEEFLAHAVKMTTGN